MPLGPLGGSHCSSWGAFVSAFGVAANATDAVNSVARMMLRMRPPLGSVRITQSNLKAEWLLPARHRAEGRQVALLDTDGVAEVEQVEQVGDERQVMKPVAGQELVELVGG